MEDIKDNAPTTTIFQPNAMPQIFDIIRHLNHKLDKMEARNRTPTQPFAPEIPTISIPSNTRVPALPFFLKQPKVETLDLYFADRKKLQGFLTQLDIYFALKSNKFSTDIQKIYFATGTLRGAAANWMEPLRKPSAV